MRLSPALSLHARDNLILQRLGDTVTDQLRAAILRLLGYRVDVVEFVELAHSPKNLLLRAARRADAPPGDVDAALRREYETTKAAWRVTPHLETLLVARCLAVEAAPAAASSLDRELAARVRAAFLEPKGGADIARPNPCVARNSASAACSSASTVRSAASKVHSRWRPRRTAE